MSVTAKPLINAKFAANANTTEYTTPAATRTIIDKFTVTNTDAATQTIAIHIVPLGGVVGDSCVIVRSQQIATGATFDSAEMRNQILNTGDFINVIASVASKLVIRASGREVT